MNAVILYGISRLMLSKVDFINIGKITRSILMIIRQKYLKVTKMIAVEIKKRVW